MRSLSLFLLLCLFAACGPAALPTPATPVPAPARELLRVYNWDTYIDPELIARFEAQSGATVLYRTFGSQSEMLAELRAHPEAHDLIVASDYAVEMLRREQRLAPLERANVPNLANLDPLFVSPAYDPGNRYCAPYLWGTVGIGYNAAVVDRPVRRWADMLERPEHRLVLIDHDRIMLGIVLLILGYSPNTTKPAEIAAARTYLAARASQLDGAVPDTGQQLLADGTADIVVEYSGDILQAAERQPELRYVIPAEGSLIWTDNLCIVRGSPQKALAERFINFILQPEPGAALANYTRYSSPNQAAMPYLRPEDRASPILYPDAQTRRRLFFLVDVGASATERYTRAWETVREALARGKGAPYGR